MTTISCKDLGHFPDTGQQSVEFLRFPLTKASISILLRVHHKLWGIILGMVQPKGLTAFLDHNCLVDVVMLLAKSTL